MLQVIDPLTPRVFIESMNCLRIVLMKLVSVRLNTVPLHLKFFQPKVEWLMKVHFLQASCFFFSRQMGNYAAVMGWVRCSLPSEISNLMSSEV